MEPYLTDLFEKFSVQEDFISVNRTHIRETLKHLSEIPHIAGKDRDKQLVEFIKGKFESFGLDHVEVRQQIFSEKGKVLQTFDFAD